MELVSWTDYNVKPMTILIEKALSHSNQNLNTPSANEKLTCPKIIKSLLVSDANGSKPCVFPIN